MTAYPAFGGSGSIAGHLALAMAARGHRIAFIARDRPASVVLPESISFHRVDVPGYPLFGEGPYTVALAGAMADVAERLQLDVLHCHYALPHAVSAFLAREMLGPAGPRVVVTLHGTDVTRIGSDPAYLRTLRFAVEAADGRSVPSAYLSRELRRRFSLSRQATPHVVPNFVDTEHFRPVSAEQRRERANHYFPGCADAPVVTHISNCRALKRIDDVVRVFALLRRQRPVRLLMVGDGPQRPAAEALATRLGLGEDDVRWLGYTADVVPALAASSLFLQTSEEESFGLAALEALSAGVPVVATRVGGVPEVVRHGETGLLAPKGDTHGLALACETLLADLERHARFAGAARADAVARFSEAEVVAGYEELYRQALGLRPATPHRLALP